MDSTTLLALCAFGFVGSMAFYVMAMLNGNDGGKIQIYRQNIPIAGATR